MSTVEEIERVIEQLPPKDFEKLSAWMALRSRVPGRNAEQGPVVFRDHRAFLNSYAPEDEGLYDAKGG